MSEIFDTISAFVIFILFLLIIFSKSFQRAKVQINYLINTMLEQLFLLFIF
ncbi:hypothetical protein HMPREF9072_02573 [Capnocytophaga sp. oral taxon 324 str. F0483]|nr:hypothetical protein HMPREF9072_02573 [Capnocytophaga sp. oral taxon 324 str. F0483]